MRNRAEKIMEAARPVFLEQFHKSSQETVLFCEQHSREVAGSFLDAFYGAVNHASLLQAGQKKNKIKYLQFSHLYSSVFSEQYLVRIDVMDERFYSDPSETESYWNADCIYRLFGEDIRQIRKRLEWQVPRMKEYEADYLRYAYAPLYHSLLKAFLKSMLEALTENPGSWKKEESWEDNARILFGEYMGQADVLFTLSKGAAGK